MDNRLAALHLIIKNTLRNYFGLIPIYFTPPSDGVPISIVFPADLDFLKTMYFYRNTSTYLFKIIQLIIIENKSIQTIKETTKIQWISINLELIESHGYNECICELTFGVPDIKATESLLDLMKL